MEIRLSVALVTRNRPESLERTLKSLRNQSVQPWEVIVSDDSDDVYVPKVRSIVATYECYYVKGPRRGLYANRNNAALLCKGTHIRTMDDDHEFPVNHIATCLRHIEEDPESIWVIGEYDTTKIGLINVRPPDYPTELHPRGFSVPPKDYQNCFAISDGASIYPQKIFGRGVRYADYYKFGPLYLEFGSRLRWLGYRIRTIQDTYVIHYYDANNRSFNDQVTEFASKFYAILCHSFIYQPSLKNKTLTTLEIVRLLILHPKIGIKAYNSSISNFKKHSTFTKKEAIFDVWEVKNS